MFGLKRCDDLKYKVEHKSDPFIFEYPQARTFLLCLRLAKQLLVA